MKRLLLLAMLLVFSTLASAQVDPWGFESEKLLLNTTFIATADLIKDQQKGSLEYLKASVFLFPRESEQQKPVLIDTNYPAGRKPDRIDFVIEDPKQTPIQFIVSSQTEIRNIFPKVTKKVPYPIKKIPPELEIYTKPSEFIDSDDAHIRRIASEIAQGEDDTYLISYKLAVWTKNNIDYSLNTLTAEVQQKASWVLDQKEGVCDELTVLFIAMARSLGIPARFVSGTAYTNWNNLDDWGPHAWAEVWIPEYGWVPFDLTYGQFGFVDSTHVVLKYSVDPSEPSIKYEWRGREAELQGRELELKTKLINKKGNVAHTISLSSQVLHDGVAIGSYNLVKTTVENLEDNYQAAELSISRPQEVIPDKETQQILLKPKEKKEVFWILQVSEDLDPGYSYTMPIEIMNVRHEKSEASFVVEKTKEFHSKEEIKEVAASLESPERTTKIASLSTFCSPEKKIVLEGEKIHIYCNIKNKGNLVLENLQICLEKQCQKKSLQLNQEEKVSFSYQPTTSGKKTLKIAFNNIYIKNEEKIEFEVFDEPKIEITELNAPTQASFVETIPVSFKLKRTSYSKPQKIQVILSLGGVEKEWIADSFDEELFSHEFLAREMNNKVPKGEIFVVFELGEKKFETKKEFSVKITHVSFFNNVRIFFNKLLNLF